MVTNANHEIICDDGFIPSKNSYNALADVWEHMSHAERCTWGLLRYLKRCFVSITMVTKLDNYDPEKEVFVAYPASSLANNKRFLAAHKKLYPNNQNLWIYHRNAFRKLCDASFIEDESKIAKQDIYILNDYDIRVINELGVEGIYDVKFFRVPKEHVYCLASCSHYRTIFLDEHRYMVKQLQKEYNIPEDVLKKHARSYYGIICRQIITEVRSQYDDEDDEDDM